MTDKPDEVKPPNVTTEEAKRQTVIFVFECLGTAASLLLLTMVTQPEKWQRFKMRTALVIKRFANSQSNWWQKIADDAATAYNREKS